MNGHKRRRREESYEDYTEDSSVKFDAVQYRIRQLDPTDESDQRDIVACVRVSYRKEKSHLRDQEAVLKSAAAECGRRVIKVFPHVGSGDDPTWLAEAAAFARKHDAVLLAEAVNRFMRSSDRSLPPYKREPGPEDIDRLMSCIGDDVDLFTVYQPSLSANQTLSEQIKRGQSGDKKKKGGRPPKPEVETAAERYNRKQRFAYAVQVLMEMGVPVRRSAKILEKPHHNSIQQTRDRIRSGRIVYMLSEREKARIEVDLSKIVEPNVSSK